MKKEIIINATNGYIMLAILLLSVASGVFFVAQAYAILGIVSFIIALFLIPGFFIINPNNSKVLLLFGAYSGTVKVNGFYWVLPFYSKNSISMKARNFESERIKVNDKLGNPIMISSILVWKVDDTYKALYEVDNFEEFVKVQTDSAVRKLAGSFPYDQFEDEQASITLSSNFEDVNKSLEEEVSERLKLAGITVIEARIGYLAYAPEIAQAMLKRQQATAIIAARSKMVEGAVGMVEGALKLLSNKKIVELDEEKKAAMVSNLLVVLCGDKETSPVINAGTLNQ
ncbi:MAG: SPFH domain-containing protein [Bacteroidales bacterium]|jgi:regulator of protease activity HflC (stomatin/prohibitin superfamily)|nr:SPFH domain-containing protein [Bacteroidales bacterium]